MAFSAIKVKSAQVICYGIKLTNNVNVHREVIGVGIDVCLYKYVVMANILMLF